MKLPIQLLTFLLLLAAGSSFAQSRTAKPTNRKVSLERPKAEIQFRQTQDTVLYPAAAELCGNFLTSYTAGDNEWGYVSGTNSYNDLEKAQRLVYTANSPYTIREVWGFFAVASAVDTGTMRMKIYTVNAETGEPDSLLGVSDSLRTSDLELDTVSILPTIFTLSDSVTLTDTTFFVSLDLRDLYEANDTVALYMTQDTCGSGDDAWELFSDSTWVPIANADISWGLNANWVVAAVVEFNETTGLNDPFVAQKGLRIFPATPNPTNDWINVSYEIEMGSQITIEVYSTDGRLLQRQNLGQQAPGRYTEQLSVQNLAPGTYVYGIITDNTRLMSRFVVSH